ncbi:dihydroorotate dehydrogenase (quinone) [Corynebacterium bouchesdurhonense]|uniref:dihydroorotate dehydrogenase (quinone) n=1 Tax=Corynebacterium bouchesdurhonense TaxID=1720192 RepID=UPI0008371CB0|nr:dihydroorotate dehydrogenase (quinone) [Corynebacterium bouchesdurhonense]
MFRIPPERIHGAMSGALHLLHSATPVNRLMERVVRVHDPALEQECFGVRFPAPLGLAAGFDKNATAVDAWGAVGFGYAELGTVTPRPQPGNPAPRLFRLPADKAILNRMGFNNEGAITVAERLAERGVASERRVGASAASDVYRRQILNRMGFNNEGAITVAERLAKRKTGDIVGINIGKNKTAEDAVADYRAGATVLGPRADYLVVNVSSPNTPGLRDLQAVEELRPILQVVKNSADTPVLVKIAPDLSDEDVDAVADLAVELGLAGIVATNTTISREGLRTPADEVAAMGAGGVSGAPVAKRSLEVLKRLHARVGDELVLVSVGGIMTPEQAWERITAGASLLQGYTPFIYGGPGWVRRVHAGIAAQLRAHGLENISEAVGSGLEWKRV